MRALLVLSLVSSLAFGQSKAPASSGGSGTVTEVTGSAPISVATGTTTPVISVTGLSGTNTGDVTLGTFGAAPDAKGATISGQVVTMQPADATHPGEVTTGTQTFAGAKTFSGTLSQSGSGGILVTGVAGGANAITFSTNGNGIDYGSGQAIRSGAGGMEINTGFLSTGTSTLGSTVYFWSNIYSSGGLYRQYTDSTASPGAATINKPAGRSAVASGAASVVITSNKIFATSNINITPLDINNSATTCQGWYVSTVAAGSFTLTCPSGNVSATWKFMWSADGTF